jgi:hypothetical protein
MALLANPKGGLDEDELSGPELRIVVERSWDRLWSIMDRTIASGRYFDRAVLIDIGRWLDGAMPAVRAYERLLARLGDEAIRQSEADRLAKRRSASAPGPLR